MEKQYMKLTGNVSDDTIITDLLMAVYDYTNTILKYHAGNGGKEVVVEITIKEIKDVV
jgi:hypothetical protein